MDAHHPSGQSQMDLAAQSGGQKRSRAAPGAKSDSIHVWSGAETVVSHAPASLPPTGRFQFVQISQHEHGSWTTPRADRKSAHSHAQREAARQKRLAAVEKLRATSSAQESSQLEQNSPSDTPKTRKRKLIEEEDAQEDSGLKSLIDNMPQMLSITKPNGYHEFYSQGWYDYTGLTKEQCIGTGWQIPFHPDDMSKMRKRWMNALEMGTEYLTEARCRNSEGSFRLMLGRAIPLRDARTQTILRWFGTCTDMEGVADYRESLTKTPSPAELLPQAALDHFDITAHQGLGSGDPFSTTVVSLTPDMRRHLNLYINCICIPSLGTARSTQDLAIWTAVARGISDPLQLYPMIMTSMALEEAFSRQLPDALKLFVANPGNPNALAGFFSAKARSIQAINEALYDTNTAIGDNVIWALCHMIIIEACQGNRDHAFTHAEGLSQIIRLRGGWQSLPLGLQFAISLTDTKITYAWRTPPGLSPLNISRRSPLSKADQLISQSASQIRRHGIRLTGLISRGFNPELLTVFENLRDRAQFQAKSTIGEVPVTEEDASYYRDLTLATEYELVTLTTRGSKLFEISIPRIEESCLLACSLIINLLWDPWPRVLWIIPSLLKYLKAALGGSNTLFSSCEGFEDALLWILFLGSHCAEGKVQRPWFISQLAKALSTVSPASWEETRNILVEFIYDEHAFGVPFERVYAEARSLTDDEG